jgi:hypothetical protein
VVGLYGLCKRNGLNLTYFDAAYNIQIFAKTPKNFMSYNDLLLSKSQEGQTKDLKNFKE